MENNMRTIRTIPANPKYDFMAENLNHKKKVCAYCRVSTDSEEQLSSYTNQVEYYTKFIKANPLWEFTGIYADEGITGTNTRKRKQFNMMVADARVGKIDMIYVKSISRFARNTVDCVSYIRELKGLGVNIHFEKENIDTIDAKGELLIIVLASLAEEESRNISENVRWNVEKRFKEGKVSLAYSRFLGYRKGEDGILEIEPIEAVLVRRIYNEFLDGNSIAQICNNLESDGIQTKAGKSKWQRSTIRSILTNEKYKGDAILQKTYQPDFLSKKRIKNEGQVKQYEVFNSHPPIVSRETFDAVQTELGYRENGIQANQGTKGRYSSNYPFSTKLRCSECGSLLRRHIQINPDKREVTWICVNHADSKNNCSMKPVKEKDIEDAFVRVMNEMSGNNEFNNANYIGLEDEIIRMQIDSYESKQSELLELQDGMLELKKRYSANNIGGDEYHSKSLELMDRIDNLIKDIRHIEDLKQMQNLVNNRRESLHNTLADNLPSDTFDGILFKALINEVLVDKTKLDFVYRAGIQG